MYKNLGKFILSFHNNSKLKNKILCKIYYNIQLKINFVMLNSIKLKRLYHKKIQLNTFLNY